MKYITVATVSMMLFACASLPTAGPTDPFEPQAVPVLASRFDSPEHALKLGANVLKEEGYLVSFNMILLKAITDPKELGYLVWKDTNEKWKISCQLSIRIIKINPDEYYWELLHRIFGSRSGRKDRLFNAEDFETLCQEIQRIRRKLMNLYSGQA